MESVITPLIAAEAIAILENTDIMLLAKVPSKLIESLQEKADELGRRVNLDYSKDFANQDISEEAKDIIALIYRDYWCTKEEREEINKKLEENERQYQEKLREKYNPDKIFESKESVKTLDNPLNDEFSTSKTENFSLVKSEDIKWYQKIFNKIKTFFSK